MPFTSAHISHFSHSPRHSHSSCGAPNPPEAKPSKRPSGRVCHPPQGVPQASSFAAWPAGAGARCGCAGRGVRSVGCVWPPALATQPAYGQRAIWRAHPELDRDAHAAHSQVDGGHHRLRCWRRSLAADGNHHGDRRLSESVATPQAEEAAEHVIWKRYASFARPLADTLVGLTSNLDPMSLIGTVLGVFVTLFVFGKTFSLSAHWLGVKSEAEIQPGE